MPTKARDRLFKRAAREIRTGQRRRRRGRPPRPEDVALEILLEEGGLPEEPPGLASATDEALPEAEGMVISVSRGWCRVAPAEGPPVDCELTPRLAQIQQSAIAAGDVVRYAPGEPPRVHHVMPRRTRLSRPDPHRADIERVLVANVDAALIALAARPNAPLRTGLLDRVIVAAEAGGVTPVVCVNKVDLLEPSESARDALEAQLEPYRQLGLSIWVGSATTGEDLDALRALIGEKLCVLIGKSGVGKSSLINALGGLHLETAAVRARDMKGRHTTTQATLHVLPGGARLVDTPGVRAFGLWKLGRRELSFYFPELAALAGDCEYRDCSHTHEPLCAVRDAVEAGSLPRARYESYRRVLKSL